VRDARGSRRMAELLVVNASSFFARQSRLAVVYTERDDAHGLHCEAFLGRERLAVVRASRRLECHPLVTVTVARNRRRAGDAALCLRCGPIAVWPAQHIAQVGNRRVALTKGESAMLLTMLAAEGEPVSRARLTAVWGRPGRPVGGRSVDTRIYALRKKLGDDARDPQLIVAEEKHAERIAALRKACEQLTERQQTALRLRYEVGLSYPALAPVLRVTRSGAEQLMARALQALRRAIASPHGKA
jgi:RNA polymerase sigma factor (sigma-70 family)